MTTLEQVEKLCQMANITYEEAKAALDAANGDMLEAIILLEKQGKIKAPSGNGYYSSEKTGYTNPGSFKSDSWENHHYSCHKGKGFASLVKKTAEFCLKIIRKGNANHVEVLKGEEIKASFPVTVLALLLFFAFWVTIPLIIIGLFFGLRYRFKGPDLNCSSVNEAMNSAAEAAEQLKNSINLPK